MDIRVLEFILSNNLTSVGISLQNNLDSGGTSVPDYSSHSAFAFPEQVKHCPEVYDTLYLTDYYLKYIYKLFMLMML